MSVRRLAGVDRLSSMASNNHDRIPAWALWLLVLFGAVQPIAWMLVGTTASRRIVLLSLFVAWTNLALLAIFASRQIGGLRRRLTQRESAHRAILNEVDQLQLQNEMLQIVARSGDVAQAFQSLASRLMQLLPCDRVGLALLSEDGQEFHTYTARELPPERRARPLPEVVFKLEGTLLGRVVQTGRPLVVDDVRQSAADCLDANVIATAGFQSALLVPLTAREHTVGTLNFVSRSLDAFSVEQAGSVQAITEILAVASVAQQLQISVARYRTIEAMSEVTLSVAAEINSALQAIVGHCDLMQREYPDQRLQRDLDTVVRQAERIASLLKRMREATQNRLEAVAGAVRHDGPAGGDETGQPRPSA
jgi:transcriptional regulator with GAF, ATPase, and Fis domain